MEIVFLKPVETEGRRHNSANNLAVYIPIIVLFA